MEVARSHVGQVHRRRAALIMIAHLVGPLSDVRKALLYYGIALALCMLGVLLEKAGPIIANLLMLAPLVSVLIMLFVVTRDGYSSHVWRDLGLDRLGAGGMSLALGVPIFVLGFAFGGLWLFGGAAFQTPPGWDRPAAYVLDLGLSILVVTFIGGIGEEIGWRGYLLPKLIGFGTGTALLGSGLLHGVWHLPVILWTPYYHADGNRLITVPLFLLTLTAAGVGFGYLRLVSGSVWPAALAHAAFNVICERLNAVTVAKGPVMLEYLVGENGLLTLIALSGTAAWLFHRLKARRCPARVTPAA